MIEKQNITDSMKPLNKDMDVLKKHFGQCFDKNGSFDIEKFRQELSKNEIDIYKESYGLDWLGKSYARILASDETTTLLREDKDFNALEENKNSQNLLIKGDNLEVLKHLSHAYHEKVKMIYIDPPYNTGSDGFLYEDNRKFTVKELQELTGVNEDKAKQILAFTQSKSNSHSAWLTFMYPRLYIAKQLLREDGVIFASIDDNEVAQLRVLMDEIFGEENFMAQLPRITTIKGKNDEKRIATSHDYVLLYGYIRKLERNKDFKSIDRYKLEDGNGKYYVEATLDSVSLPYSKGLDYEINIDGASFSPITYNGKKTCWRWSEDLVSFGIQNNLIVNKKGRLYTKTYLDLEITKIDGKYKLVKKEVGGTYRSELLFDYKFSNNEASRSLKSLNIPFDYPKPVTLLNQIIKLLPNKNGLFLDFFAGSGTTGDAVMQLNAEDGGDRKFIMVQLPESIDAKKNSVAYDFVKDELGIDEPTIFDITKERLIRAANKIKTDNPLLSKLTNQDMGFKVFEIMPIWDGYNLEADEFNPQVEIFNHAQLTDDDLNALLITWKTYDGSTLTEPLIQYDLGGYCCHYVNEKLYLMDRDFSTSHLINLLQEIDTNKQFNPQKIIAFGYNFDSKNLREIAENIKSYANKKSIDLDFITGY